jgi:hypothetical protein
LLILGSMATQAMGRCKISGAFELLTWEVSGCLELGTLYLCTGGLTLHHTLLSRSHLRFANQGPLNTLGNVQPNPIPAAPLPSTHRTSGKISAFPFNTKSPPERFRAPILPQNRLSGLGTFMLQANSEKGGWAPIPEN